MKKKLILSITEMNKIYQLENYGRITYIDEFIEVVFIETDESNVSVISDLPFVSGVEVSGKGSLLHV